MLIQETIGMQPTKIVINYDYNTKVVNTSLASFAYHQILFSQLGINHKDLQEIELNWLVT